MQVELDELIKWILAQYDDLPSEELRMKIFLRLFAEEKEVLTDEQKRDKRPCAEGAGGGQSGV